MYDNVCKFLSESFSSDFASWLLGKAITLTQLNPTELAVEPIRADTIILLESSDLILHLEFQTKADQNIPYRMADYRLRAYRKFPNKQMQQTVIYLKPTSSQLVYQNAFIIPTMRHEFNVIRIWVEIAIQKQVVFKSRRLVGNNININNKRLLVFV